jgi:ABC-type transport system involved in multi-copper enzyme maturation permease subunit
MGSIALTAGVVCTTYAVSFGASALEDKNKVDMVLNSLPIKRSSIVIAKYLSVFVYAFAALLVCFVIYSLAKWLSLPVKVVPFTFEGAAGAVIAAALFSAINYPIIFKYGYIKSRGINFVLFFLFFFGGNTLYDYARDHSWLEKLLQMTGYVEVEQILLLTMLFSLIFVIISLLLSISIYKRREFS